MKTLLVVTLIFLLNQSFILADGDQYMIAPEKIPTAVGGIEGIMKKITYPADALKAKIEGKVYMLVYINENGVVDDVAIVKGLSASLDEETIRAVKKTKFTPGMDKGIAVKCKISLSVSLKVP